MRKTLLITSLLILLVFLIIFNRNTGFFLKTGDYSCEECNVILVTIDTLRADHVSSYGYFKETTPNIDNLGEEGIVFLNAFSQIPFTPPSHWSIMSSIYPHKHGKYYPTNDSSGLIPMATIMKNNGYSTAGFISSRMVKNFNKDFSHFETTSSTKKADEITFNIIKWIDENSDKKFFLWAHYFDPHSPYEPPEEFDIFNHSDENKYSDNRYDQLGVGKKETLRKNIEKYDGEIRFVDNEIGKIIEKLDELNISENTLIVITSDHGECFGEHNFSEFGYEKKYPCVFHGKTLFEEEIKIPLIIKNPKSSIKKRVSPIAESVDILPTILDMVGIKYDGFNFDGGSLVPVIMGKKIRDYTISQTKPLKTSISAKAIRDKNWKFVSMVPSEFDLEEEMRHQVYGGDLPDEELMEGWKKFLFRIDKNEKGNYFEKKDKLAKSMEEKLKSEFEFEIKSSGEVDKEVEDILRDLGYIE